MSNYCALRKHGITQDVLKYLFSYNEETGIFTWVNPTSPNAKAGMKAGTLDSQGYVRIRIGRYKFAGHRMAWLYVKGEYPKNKLDHVNHITSDNRILNLRDVSNSQNGQNQIIPHSNNKIGLLGVSRRGDRFAAQICKDWKVMHIGTFDTPEEAHAAYLKRKRDIHEACTI